MSEALRLITPPVAEPVTLEQFKGLLRLPLADISRDDTLNLYLTAAREAFEAYCRIAIVTQTWLWRLDSFPTVSLTYDRNGYPEFRVPKPPFQSVDFFQYVDTSGQLQTLTRETSYGTNSASPFYGYQMDPGGGISPARLTAPWARPWAPQRLVPANTVLQFRCGYGGPVKVTTVANSAAISTPGFTFNADDAPSLVGDVGAAINIPGAGADGAALGTNVASVDAEGNAMLATAATMAVADATAYLGDQVPSRLQLGILFLAQHFYELNAIADADEPGVIERLRRHSRNMVS